MFSNNDVLETIAMVEKEHLDIRTITMGLSLLSCIRDNAKDTARKVYDLVCKKAENIVKVASDLSGEYGIPIVNKRVSVTPVSLLCAAFPKDAPLIGNDWNRLFGRLFRARTKSDCRLRTGIYRYDPRSACFDETALFLRQRRFYQDGNQYGSGSVDG